MGSSPLARLDDLTSTYLRQAGEVAADLGLQAFLVGGAVRDLLRGAAPSDCDLATEGRASDLALALATRWRAPTALHPRFMTATLRLPDGRAFDIATARGEHYPEPGALPRVVPSDIGTDLWRRDFGVNALAIALNPDRWGELRDPVGGRADLANGVIRALHSRSFWDDATRIVRAIAFEQRLGLGLAPCTARWLRSAGRDGALATVSGQRLRDALLPVLGTTAGPAVLLRLDDLGLLGAMLGVPELRSGARSALAQTARDLLTLEPAPTAGARAVACLVAVTIGGAAGAGTIAAHLNLDHSTGRELGAAAAARDRWPDGLQPPGRASGLAGELQGVGWGAIVALWLTSPSPSARQALAHYWRQLRCVQPDVTPADLIAHGVPPGPAVGEALRAALAAKLDHHADATRQREVALRAALTYPD